MRSWVLINGVEEDDEASLGVAEAVADVIERRALKPRAPWRWLSPFGPIDPRDEPGAGSGPIAPRADGLWPDLAIGCGRLAAPYLARLKDASGGRTVTVLLRPSFLGSREADLIWTPGPRGIIGGSMVISPTAPHRVGAVRLAAARGGAPIAPRQRGVVRVGVLIEDERGGPTLNAEESAKLVAALKRLSANGAAVMVRAPKGAPDALNLALRDVAHYVWSGEGPDPYLAILAQSDVVVIAARSPKMLNEAPAAGAPILVFQTSAAEPRTKKLIDDLTALGVVRPFAGRIERCDYDPLDSTIDVAHAIRALAITRCVLTPEPEPATRALSREINGRNS